MSAPTLREAAQRLCNMDAGHYPVCTLSQWHQAYSDLNAALARPDEPPVPELSDRELGGHWGGVTSLQDFVREVRLILEKHGGKK